MRATKKWFALCLSALLLIVQMTGVLAEDTQARTIEALLATGREVSYTASIEWQNLPMVDEETNALLAALFSSLEVEGRVAKTDEANGYSTFAMNISGEKAISASTVVAYGDTYIETDALGSKQVAIPEEDMEGYMTNLGRYLDKMMEAQGSDTGNTSFEALYAQLYSIQGQMAAQAAAPEAGNKGAAADDAMQQLTEAYAAFGMEDMLKVASDWFAEEIKTETVEEDTGSVFGIDSAKADVTTLTREQVIELFEMLTPMLMENDAYWATVLNVYEQYRTEDEPELTLEDFKEQAPEVEKSIMEFVQEIPEGSELKVYTCYDAKGEHILSKVECLVPEDSTDVKSDIYAEWVPGGMPFYAELIVDLEGVRLTVTGKEDVPGGPKDDGFHAVLEVIDYGDPAGEVVLDCSSISTEEENGYTWDGAVTLSIMEASGDAAGMQMGLSLTANQVATYEGNDVKIDGTYGANIDLMGFPMPLVTAKVTVETGVPQGEPFEIDSDAVRPGAMDEAEFDAYMSETVMPASMKLGMRVFSMLPEEVFSALSESIITDTTGN